jgi:hypothetical protein
VMMEKIFPNAPGGKCRPSPMVLAFHNNQELFAKSCSIHAAPPFANKSSQGS